MCLYDLSLVSKSFVNFPLSETLGFLLHVSSSSGKGVYGGFVVDLFFF